MVIAEPHEVTMALGLHIVGRQAREESEDKPVKTKRGVGTSATEVESSGEGSRAHEQEGML